MIELGLLIWNDGSVWIDHDAPNRTSGSIGDNPNLWRDFWENRKIIAGHAHTHPGGGVPGPSWTDVSTYSAIELGLGKRLDWYVVNRDAIVICRWKGPGAYDYEVGRIREEPCWVEPLRIESGITTNACRKIGRCDIWLGDGVLHDRCRHCGRDMLLKWSNKSIPPWWDLIETMYRNKLPAAYLIADEWAEKICNLAQCLYDVGKITSLRNKAEEKSNEQRNPS